jgi:hypothetical protein
MYSGLFWGVRTRDVSARIDAQAAKGKANRVEIELSALTRQVEHLSLACQALWELLRDNTNFEEDHILEKMQEIDMRDGKPDGRMHRRVLECPECGRKANSQRERCLYCGADMYEARGHVFE